MTEEKLPREEVIRMWEEFSDTPITDEDLIDEPFYDWEVGTDRFEIWHWFDRQLPHGLGQFLYWKEGREAATNEDISLFAVDVQWAKYEREDRDTRNYTDREIVVMMRDVPGVVTCPTEWSRGVDYFAFAEQLEKCTGGRATPIDRICGKDALFYYLDDLWFRKRCDELERYKRELKKEFILPAGTYLLGAPSDLISDDFWQAVMRNWAREGAKDFLNGEFFHYTGEGEQKDWYSVTQGHVLFLSITTMRDIDGHYVDANGAKGYWADFGLFGVVDIRHVATERNEDARECPSITSKYPIKVVFNRTLITFTFEDAETLELRMVAYEDEEEDGDL